VSRAQIFSVVLGLSAFVPAAQAATGNLGFLADTPYAFMKDEDRARFHAALDAALNQAADGETREWSSPHSRSSGKLTVVRTLQDPEDGKWLPRTGS
jgi:surface antigen